MVFMPEMGWIYSCCHLDAFGGASNTSTVFFFVSALQIPKTLLLIMLIE